VLDLEDSETLVSEHQVEHLIPFAEWLLDRVAGIWNSASLAPQGDSNPRYRRERGFEGV
jgi:hypothetical protein